MTAKTRYLNTYRTVRKMNFLWWILAALSMLMAAKSLSAHSGEPNIVMFMVWVGAATGFIVAIKRGNKARAKVNG